MHAGNLPSAGHACPCCSEAQRQEHAAFLMPLLEAGCFEGVQVVLACEGEGRNVLCWWKRLLWFRCSISML